MKQEQLKSTLPKLDMDIKIRTLNTLHADKFVASVKIKSEYRPVSDEDVETQTTETQRVLLCELTHPKIDGYLPSRVWYDKDRGFVLMYYTNESITVRPLKNQRTFCFYLPERLGEILSYDMRASMFIDQICGPGDKIHYFFVFGDMEWNMLVADDMHTVLGGIKTEETLQPKVSEELPAKTRKEQEKQDLCHYYAGACVTEMYNREEPK